MLTGALRKMSVLQLLQTRSLSNHTILLDRRSGIFRSAEHLVKMFLDYYDAPVLLNEDWFNLEIYNYSVNRKLSYTTD